MPNAYPPIKIPPKAAKTTSANAVFNAFINDHPSMRPYADTIAKYATAAGVDKVVAATLLWHEGFAEAQRQGVDPNTITSPTGEGVGPAQINPKVWVGKKTQWGETITESKLTNPEFNIRFGLTYFASLPGDVDQKYAAYSGGANFTLSSALPKNYVPQAGLTPQEKGQQTAVQSAATKKAETVLGQKWAVLGADGRVKFVAINDPTVPPKNVLTYGTTPLTQQSFLTTWKQNYADTFFSYTGRNASGKEVASILKNAPSLYTLANTLATTKSFTTSPTYKAHAPGVIAIAKQLYGNDWKVDKSLVTTAISQNWDQATLEEKLRERPEYANGPEYKDTVAKFSNAYQQIYGTPDANGNAYIQNAAKQGWTQDELALALRTAPEYKQSQEYKTKVLSFAQQLGLITGQVPTLTADQAGLGGAPAAPAPTSPPPSVPPPPATVPPGHGSGPTPYIPPQHDPSGGPN